ncbi:MAG: NAD(+)/NADH kinase, partial [Clostridia bacterium]|nr:NAD(+)/NADH kinase [Clostridia bacterium]
MKTFSLIVNYKNRDSCVLAENIIKRLKQEPINLLLPPDRPGFSTHDKGPIDLSGVDMLVVLGGDGTILASSKLIAGQDTPIFAINMGQVGFLSEVEPQDAMNALEVLIKGEYFI